MGVNLVCGAFAGIVGMGGGEGRCLPSLKEFFRFTLHTVALIA
jgi:hypothetical protein